NGVGVEQNVFGARIGQMRQNKCAQLAFELRFIALLLFFTLDQGKCCHWVLVAGGKFRSECAPSIRRGMGTALREKQSLAERQKYFFRDLSHFGAMGFQSKDRQRTAAWMSL